MNGYTPPPLSATALAHFSPHDHVLALGFVVAGALSGITSFFIGSGIHDLATAPRYAPTLPEARDVVRTPALAAEPRAALPSTPDVVETPSAGNWIRIPALSIDLPLVASRSMESADVLRALQIGVVRYPNGVEPGQPGVVVVSGHSTGEPWKGRYRFAFLHAKNLHVGDAIYVDHEGVRYTYRVIGQRLLNPRSTPFLESRSVTARLALVSCWPIWTTRERLAIDAELVGTARLVVSASARGHQGS